MQFMYATGRRFGLGPDGTGFDTRYDPRAAAEASAAYLNERMGQLNRSIELALAAYNGGGHTQLYAGSGSWTDYTVQTSVRLQTASNYPGGLRGRVNLTSGAGYAAWLYPSDGVIKLSFGRKQHVLIKPE